MTSPDKNLDTNDLDLLAFRYIANEMALDERAAFESRLADDQAACEAVAGAVEMAQALALTVGELDAAVVPGSIVPTSNVPDQREHRLSWLRPAAWMSAGAAACLFAVLVSQLMMPDGDRLLTKSSKSQAESRADKLALVWSQIRQPEGADDAKTDVDSLPADDAENTASDTMVSASSKTPSWIAAAISGLSETKKTDRNADDDTEEL